MRPDSPPRALPLSLFALALVGGVSSGEESANDGAAAYESAWQRFRPAPSKETEDALEAYLGGRLEAPPPGVAAWVESNAAALDLTETAARSGRVTWPVPGPTSGLPAVVPPLRLAMLETFRARTAVARGNSESALGTLSTVLASGRHLTQGCLVQALLGIRVRRTALDGILVMIRRRELPPGLAALLRSRLEEEADLTPTLDAVLLMESRFAMAQVEFAMRGVEFPGAPGTRESWIAQMKAEVDAHYARLAEWARSPPAKDDPPPEPPATDDIGMFDEKLPVQDLVKRLTALLEDPAAIPRRLAHVLLRAIVLDPAAVRQAWYGSASHLALVEVALELEDRREREGAYPATFGEDSGPLAAGGADPFRGQPPEYATRGPGYVLVYGGPDRDVAGRRSRLEKSRWEDLDVEERKFVFIVEP